MIWTLIPAKSFTLAKSRLGPTLDGQQRADLGAALLARTLRVVRTAFGAQPLLVVSPDEDVAAFARDRDAETVLASCHGLNAQLAEAAARVPGEGSLLVLHADLPMLQPEDLHALAGITGETVLCPDRLNEGTNALLQRGISRDFRFGLGSFLRYRSAAAADGTDAVILHRPGLALDLDTPEDWREWERLIGPLGRCHSVQAMIDRLNSDL